MFIEVVKQLVLLLYGNQYCSKRDVPPKNTHELNQELGGGELYLSVCPGVGNRQPRKKKIANPGGMLGGGGKEAWLQVKLNHA